MPFINPLNLVYPITTLAGVFVLVSGIVITALTYRGTQGERYSLLNHFISELGEVGVSRLAWVFNTCMIIAGILFLPMMVGLGFLLHTAWAKLAMVSGLVAALACICVGIFPMNKIKPHTAAALTYFRSGLVTVLLFTIAIFAQPRGEIIINMWVSAFGFLSVIIYSVFLLDPAWKKKEGDAEGEALDPGEQPSRPRFWRLPFVEWLVFFSTILWFLVLVL